MCKLAIPRSFLWLVSIVAILTIGTIGCGDSESVSENDEWVGTWSLQTTDGRSLEQVFVNYGEVSVVTNTWRFYSDGTIEGEIAVKIDAKKGFTEVVENGIMKLTGTYALSGSNYVITPEDAEATGFFEISEDWEGTAEEEQETGAWTRSGDTLVLTTEFNITVFKMK